MNLLLRWLRPPEEIRGHSDSEPLTSVAKSGLEFLAPVAPRAPVRRLGKTTSGRALAAVVCAAVMVQLLLSSITFPIHELVSETPLFYIDGVQHWYRMTAAVNLAADGNVVGYDPYFGAGTSIGISANPAAKVPAAAAVISGADPIVVWKLYSVVAGLIAAACVPFVLGWLGFGRHSAAIGALLGLLLWWTSIFRWFHTAGLVSYVLAMYLAVIYIAGVMRYIDGAGGRISVFALGLCGGLGLLVHPLFIVPVAVITALYLGSRLRRIRRDRLVALLVLVPAVSVLPSLLWIYYTFVMPLADIHSGPPHQTFDQSIVDPLLPLQEFFGIWRGSAHGSKVYPLIGLGALAGCLLARQDAEWHRSVHFAVAGVMLIIYATFGGMVDQLAQWTQPNRFAPAGYLMLTIPAARGTWHIFRRLLRSNGHRGCNRLLIAAAIVTGLIFINVNELRREVSYADIGHYGARPPEVRPIGPYSEFILRWLAEHTTSDARILFEASNGRFHDGGHMAGYYAYRSGREFVGGTSPFDTFASFTDSWLFGRSIDTFTSELLAKYLDLYNIGWIIAHSDVSKRFLRMEPGIAPLESYNGLQTYRVERTPSYFVTGQGRVASRAHNKVTLSMLEGEVVILKYHLLPRLRAVPHTRLEPVYLLDDPTPFVLIRNAPPELVLEMD